MIVMDAFIVELVAVFVVAVLVGIVFRYFGLPAIVGHVLAGLFLGLSGVISSPSVETLEQLGTLGVTLLLFLVGLEMNWNEIKRVGKEAIFVFLGQTLGLFVLYSLLGVGLLGFSVSVALMFAAAMSFCSTIVLVKVLSEKKELNSYLGRLSLGVLLLQDVAAILLLVLLPSIGGKFDFAGLVATLGKLAVLAVAVNVLGHYFVSMLMKHVVKTAEDLVLFSLAWFAVVIYGSVTWLGLTPEVSGLMAGLSLSTSWGHFQIVSKVKVLRDAFLTMFFVLLGFRAGLGQTNWELVGILVVAIILGKFAVTHLAARVAGLNGRGAIILGLNMTQVSEFSLVVMGSGLSLGLWSESIVKAVTLSGLISMALSTLLIGKSEKISMLITKISRLIFVFGGRNKQTKVQHKGHIVLLGGDRTGKSLLSFLDKLGEKVVVVDFNPQVINELKSRGAEVIFADITDPDTLELANVPEAKLVISTVKSLDDTLSFLENLSDSGRADIPVIVDAENLAQAKKLYWAGATYVILPHFVSGWHISRVIKRYGGDKKVLERYRLRQDGVLKEAYGNEY